MNRRIIYDTITERAKLRGLNKKLLVGYFERHHIIPRCLGGSNEDCNYVLLTAREHFICHKLLHRMNPKSKTLTYALHMMYFSKSDGQHRDYKISSRDFEMFRIEFSNSNRGEGNPFHGKSHSIEARRVISEKRKGCTSCRKGSLLTDDTKLKLKHRALERDNSKGFNSYNIGIQNGSIKHPRCEKMLYDGIEFYSVKKAFEYAKEFLGYEYSLSKFVGDRRKDKREV